MHVFKTKDYSKFKLLEGNRDLNQTHLKNLEASILKNNMLDQNPMKVNEIYEVIDGQHRLKVAEKNDLYIYYIITRGAKLPEVQLLNTTKSWTVMDFLESNIKLGNNDYSILKEFMREYDLPLSASMSLLTGSTARPRDLITHFKDGKFQIVSLNRAVAIAKIIGQIKPYCVGDVWKNRDFINALLFTLKKVPVKKFLEKLPKSKNKFMRRVNYRDYLIQFDDFINFRAVNKIKIY